MNGNQKAINAVFGNKAQFKTIMNNAHTKFEEYVNEDTTFEEAVEHFCYELNTIMSEHAATTTCGVDITHYYCRNNSQMQAIDVQFIINDEVICPDQAVNDMFKKLKAGKIKAAYEIFLCTFDKVQEFVVDNTLENWMNYLISVNMASDGPNEFSTIISNFEKYSKMDELEIRLRETLPCKGAEKPIKI